MADHRQASSAGLWQPARGRRDQANRDTPSTGIIKQAGEFSRRPKGRLLCRSFALSSDRRAWNRNVDLASDVSRHRYFLLLDDLFRNHFGVRDDLLLDHRLVHDLREL